MKYVYTVYHVNPKNDDKKSIGVYFSLIEAEAVVAKYKSIKGFRDAPDHFYIDKYELNKMYWSEGYHSVKVKSKQD